MTDQPWVPDIAAAEALRRDIVEAMDADRQPEMGPDPNAELFKKAQDNLPDALRIQNPQVYRQMTEAFAAALTQATREGVVAGLELAINIVDGVAEQAAEDDYVNSESLAYIEGIKKAIRRTQTSAKGTG